MSPVIYVFNSLATTLLLLRHCHPGHVSSTCGAHWKRSSDRLFLLFERCLAVCRDRRGRAGLLSQLSFLSGPHMARKSNDLAPRAPYAPDLDPLDSDWTKKIAEIAIGYATKQVLGSRRHRNNHYYWRTVSHDRRKKNRQGGGVEKKADLPLVSHCSDSPPTTSLPPGEPVWGTFLMRWRKLLRG